jgi:hypothetical protein
MRKLLLLPWEKVAGGASRMRENHDGLRLSLIRHAPHDTFSIQMRQTSSEH